MPQRFQTSNCDVCMKTKAEVNMALIVRDITKSYGFHQILNGVSFVANDGEHIGLVGANGVGKSTLLKIIKGVESADGGAIELKAGQEIGYLEQVIKDTLGKTLEAVITEANSRLIQLETEMRELETAMTTTQGDELQRVMAAYGEALELFERYGGYEMENRVDAVLDGLGVGHIQRDRLYDSLSGGEKTRVALAVLLLKSPDVLLLDEPTNHLDILALTWLESYLQTYRGAILAVSHDRQFLNRTVTAIVEIDEHSRQAKRYSGTYDDYFRAKQLELRKWREDFANQLEEIKLLRYEIKVGARRNDNNRMPKDGDKHILNAKIAKHDRTVSKRIRTAEERLSRLEDDLIPEPPEDLRFQAEFDVRALRGHYPLVVTHLSKSYGANCVLNDLSFAVETQDRIVFAGPNGAGKSTLLRILMGDEAADGGDIQINPGVKIGYLSQEATVFDPQMTLFEAFSQDMPLEPQQLKAFLMRAGLFHYDELGKRVGELSSGQERKLQLGRIIASGANMLVLDEPTNHISFDVLEQFERALKDFPGPIIAASHDRRFMETFGGQIWELQDGQFIKYVDGYVEYTANSAVFA